MSEGRYKSADDFVQKIFKSDVSGKQKYNQGRYES